ncbi:MAG: glycoside hydrolase family 15 protein [Acidimicrobiales bacterium]
MSGPAPTPIGDYALVSDSQGAALVSRSGSVDWACVPRFDSPSALARLLGEGAGAWALAPTGAADVERSYVDGTMVLRTVFRTGSGAVAVTDAMPFLPTERGHGIGDAAPHAIVRLVEGLDGDVEVATEVAPRPEYGLTVPRWAPAEGGATCRGGPAAYVLSCPAPLDLEGGTARGRFGVRAGQRVGLALRAVDPWEPLAATWSTDQVRAWLYGTVRGWQSWSALHQGYQGPYADLVHHSGRVLQALTYAPSGAIVAAPTTSLPEQVGGSRNWDYRYAWVRDASLTLSALWVAACPDEVADFFGFFMTAAGGTCEGEDPVQILYGVGGERRLDEQELDHLGGYRDSRPVRVGNGAWRQSQLDVYGELLDAAGLYADRVASFDDATASFLADLADRAATRWEEPDHGIWEMRGGRRHFLYSKLMCWVALDRACALARSLRAGERAGRWRRERERIRQAILDQGWSDRAKAFTQAFGHDDLDASVLMIPIVGFLPAGDDRVRATVAAIGERLSDERGLVYRYRGGDGLDGSEASFGVCTYWLAHALALEGDVEGARRRFETVTSFANDGGLLSEEIDGATGELLGNFPQAFTHIGLVNAANAIAEAEGGARPR